MSTSSWEAEYYAYSSAVKDLEYVRLLLRNLRLFPDDASPPTMLVDSEQAMAMSQSPMHRSHTKHIEFTMALARDYIQRGLLWKIVLQLNRLLICKQLGHGPFVVFRGRFMRLVPFLSS